MPRSLKKKKIPEHLLKKTKNLNILYRNRVTCKDQCICKKNPSRIKKRKVKSQREPNPLSYPQSNEVLAKTFQIKSNKNLSLTAKLILNTFQNKYIYYAIDDILYLLNSRVEERNYLLEVLYSPIISLQNNFSINFFDVWIRDISIEKLTKPNKFLQRDSKSLKQLNFITIKFFYKTRIPLKKQESLW